MPPRVVNMVPFANSGETRQDSEPNLTVNPSDPLQMVGSAFTPDPAGGVNAPVYVSTDGGETWVLNLIVPSQHPVVGTGDITVRFGTTTNVLYAGILRRPAAVGLRLDILRATNFTAATPMTVLVDRDTSPGPDQPYLQAATTMGGGISGRDRVYVGTNDRPGVGTRTSTVDWSLDAVAATPPPPSRIPDTDRRDPRHAIAGWICVPARHPPQRHHLRRVPGMAHILWRQHHVGRVHRPRRQTGHRAGHHSRRYRSHRPRLETAVSVSAGDRGHASRQRHHRTDAAGKLDADDRRRPAQPSNGVRRLVRHRRRDEHPYRARPTLRGCRADLGRGRSHHRERDQPGPRDQQSRKSRAALPAPDRLRAEHEVGIAPGTHCR